MEPTTLFEFDPDGAGVRIPEHAAGGGARPGPSPTAVRARSEPETAFTLLAVDGDSLAHRAFHGYRPERTQGPLYGFLALLVAICDQVRVDALVVGFDSRDTSTRRARHPEYKAQRDEKDPSLVSFLADLPVALADLGLSVRTVGGWEADDVVASAAATAEAAGWRCAVATSDRDAFCVVSERTTVLRLRGRSEIVAVTPRRLARDLRITPGQYVDFAALRGDVSDNLPGVPGIGPARASSLLSAYPSVEVAAADPIGCRSVLGRDLGQVLIDDLASDASVFRRNVELMTLRRDLDIDLDAASRRPRPEVLGEQLAARGLGALAARVGAALGARPEAAPVPDGPPPGA